MGIKCVMSHGQVTEKAGQRVSCRRGAPVLLVCFAIRLGLSCCPVRSSVVSGVFLCPHALSLSLASVLCIFFFYGSALVYVFRFFGFVVRLLGYDVYLRPLGRNRARCSRLRERRAPRGASSFRACRPLGSVKWQPSRCFRFC